jgi:hypothetical protein
VAGFIHIGTETRVPPERPRPDMDAITTWMSRMILGDFLKALGQITDGRFWACWLSASA